MRFVLAPLRPEKVLGGVAPASGGKPGLLRNRASGGSQDPRRVVVGVQGTDKACHVTVG